jgi:hypothetical protein
MVIRVPAAEDMALGELRKHVELRHPGKVPTRHSHEEAHALTPASWHDHVHIRPKGAQNGAQDRSGELLASEL